MRKFSKTWALALSVAAISMVACESGDDSNITDSFSSSEQDAFMSVYVDDVIMTRYTELSSAGKTLLTAVEAIAASTEADKTSLIATAAEAWVDARIAWERTEAYLFGPVDMAGIDPGIDSWPLVLPDLQTSIQEWDPTTDSYISLKTDGGDLKGFHAIEYMLFADGAAKEETIAAFDSEYAISQGDLSDEDFEDKLESYAVAVSTELYRCVLQLEAEWNLSGLSSSKLSDFNDFGSNITMLFPEGNYAELFKNPSIDNAYYSSFNVCLFAAFEGAIGITDEVANTKIADPIDAETESAGSGLLEVESWFSHNSISDFTNNMRGVKEAYMGVLCTDETLFDALTTPADGSLGAIVADADATVGATVVTTINDAITAIKAMPSPFRENLLDSANKTAQDAINTALEALETANALILE